MVLQIDDDRMILQFAGLNDYVELPVLQPRITPRDNVDVSFQTRVKQSVRAVAEQTSELAVVESQTHLVAADSNCLDWKHVSLFSSVSRSFNRTP